MSRYSDLIEAEVSLDFSNLEARLDEIAGLSEEDVDARIRDFIDSGDFESRISSLESLNTCGVDLNDLADVPNRVDVLESTVEGFADLQARVDTLEGNDDVPFRALEARIASLEASLQTAAALTGDRLDRLEATSNTAYNFFSLLGKMISLLLNGSRS